MKIAMGEFKMQKGVNVPIREFMNIDFLRILFAIIIVWYHSFGNLKSYIPLGDTLNTFSTNCKDAYLIVEFFFIISGFFLLRGICAQQSRFGGGYTPQTQ